MNNAENITLDKSQTGDSAECTCIDDKAIVYLHNLEQLLREDLKSVPCHSERAYRLYDLLHAVHNMYKIIHPLM